MPRNWRALQAWRLHTRTLDAAWRRVGLDIRLALARAEPTASIMEPRQPSPTTALRYPTLPYPA